MDPEKERKHPYDFNAFRKREKLRPRFFMTLIIYALIIALVIILLKRFIQAIPA